MNKQAVFLHINETPRKISIIGGVTKKLITPLNLFQTYEKVTYQHTYATVKLCKLRGNSKKRKDL